ncbi:MAG TPA: ligand-binding protein SH3 [Paraburkholderia sp.]|jgi:multidrug transporter EmrE-like cation transporter|nr:ligand-binding protein SH3 [Paraburkholderia sp.]
MSILLLLISGSCSAIASILLRVASQYAVSSGNLITLLFERPNLMRGAALGAYGIGFLLYAVALKRVELGVAYPVMVAVTVIELFLFSLWTGDGLTLRTVSGAALLIAGVWLLYSARGTPV